MYNPRGCDSRRRRDANRGGLLWTPNRISVLNAQNYVHKGPQRLVIEQRYLLDRNYLVPSFPQDKRRIKISI